MKKNQKIIIMAAIAVAVVAVIVAYTMISRRDSTDTADTGSAETTTESTDSATTKSTGTTSTEDEEDGEDPLASSSLTITVTDGTITSLKEYPVEDYVTLGDYIGMEISMAAPEEVDDETVTEITEYYFSYMAASYAAELTAGQLVKEGDTANIDYTGYLDGVAFDGGSASGYDLVIGSGTFIDGFEEGLIGVAVGDTVDLELTFPSSYSSNPSLAGQEVVFTVTVNYVTPDLTDENVETVTAGECTTVEELKSIYRDYLEYEAAYSYQTDLDSAVYEELLSICTVSEVPDFFYNMIYENLVASIESEAAQYGLDGDTYCTYFVGYSLAEYAVLTTDEYVPEYLIFQAIANVEELNPTDEELDEQAEIYMSYYGCETLDDLYESYISRDMLEIYLMMTNVSDFLAENAVITYTDATE